MIEEKEIGKRLKELRVKQGFTLESLSLETGFSKGYLSKVENSKKAPPVSTLTKLSQALRVGISAIFGEKEKVVSYHITKRDKRPAIARKGSKDGYSYESLAMGYSNRKMDPYIIEFPDNVDLPSYQHIGEELFFILTGTIRVVFGDIEFVLEEGDCCYFDSNIEHRAYSVGEQPATALMVFYSS